MEYVEEPLISCELREAPLPVLLEASQHILTLVEWLLSLYATVLGIKCLIPLVVMRLRRPSGSACSGAMKPFFRSSL